jgi:hypothetical protein
MLGHWLIWRGGNVAAARERFETALTRGGESRPLVRRFQLAALVNEGSDGEDELLRVVNRMREQGEPLAPRMADHVYTLYARRHGPSRPARRAADDPLSPSDSLAVYEWVLRTEDAAERSPAVSAFIRSALQEAAGDRAAALATLRELQERERLGSPFREQVQQAVVRLGRTR